MEIQGTGSALAVRTAKSADAGALAVFAEETFRATFAPFNTVSDMDEYCSRCYGEAIQRAEILDPDISTFLCEIGGELAGYAQIGWNSRFKGIEDPSQAEIKRIYVKAEWQGRGVSHELMNHVLAAADSRGVGTVWLGVWEKNPKAVTFYRKFDFYEAGEHVFMLGQDRQRDIVLNRKMRGRSDASSPKASR